MVGGVYYMLLFSKHCMLCLFTGAEVTILQSIFVSPVAGRMYFK